MPAAPLPPAVQALIAAGVKLVRSTTSGRLALAQLHAVVDPDGLPPELRDSVMRELDAAAATVTALDAGSVAKVLKDCWRADPRKIADDLDLDAPLAVTAAAQVHRARIDGQEVIVKVLRPGVPESVRSDLGLLETLTAPARAAFPGVDAGAVVREVRERVLDELDLEHQASVQRSVARALRRHPTISVPAPITELSHDQVLVAAHVDGPTLAAGVPAGTDPGALARTLVRAFLGLPRTAGIVHADADPANVILTGGETIALVDFGATHRVDTARLDAALDALAALRADDGPAFTGAVQRLGVLEDAGACDEARSLLREVGGDLLTGPARLDAAALVAAAARAESRLTELLGLATQATLDPQDLWPLRMLGTLAATLARLGATEDWVALGLEAGREGC